MRYLKGMQHDRGLEGWKCARKRQYDPLLTSRIPPQSKRCQKNANVNTRPKKKTHLLGSPSNPGLSFFHR